MNLHKFRKIFEIFCWIILVLDGIYFILRYILEIDVFGNNHYLDLIQVILTVVSLIGVNYTKLLKNRSHKPTDEQLDED